MGGLLGVGDPADESANPQPQRVARDVASASIEGAVACFLDEQARAYCWGDNRYGELVDGTRVSQRSLHDGASWTGRTSSPSAPRSALSEIAA